MRCPLSKVIILSNTTPRAAARQFLQSSLVSASHMTSLSKPIWHLPETISVLSKLAGGEKLNLALPGVLSSGILGFLLSFHMPPGEEHRSALVERRPMSNKGRVHLEGKQKLASIFLYIFSFWDYCSQECFGGVGFQRFSQESSGRS